MTSLNQKIIRTATYFELRVLLDLCTQDGPEATEPTLATKNGPIKSSDFPTTRGSVWGENSNNPTPTKFSATPATIPTEFSSNIESFNYSTLHDVTSTM